ncbi:hypothetical protein [Streptomyces sp. NRRL B-1347]|uniref:hypothetical protein n=1 Tax=Streptomyces sp. NRRL B-1347 TaxID=1476877 RepID=UPI0004C89F2E|nr:hypothetical protein [Streptomyces sp. NRRL B-1347]
MRRAVVEAGQVGARLRSIGALRNVPGDCSTGPELAETLAVGLARHQDGRVLDGGGRVFPL